MRVPRVFKYAGLCLFSYVTLAEEASTAEDSPDDSGPSAVLKLGKANFETTLAENKFVMVKWYAPWCGHCKSMKSDYIKAAEVLESKSGEGDLSSFLEAGTNQPVLGEVDATIEAELATQYDVQGYPTVHWFVNGVKKTDYSGARTTDGILTWIRENVGPNLKELKTADVEILKEKRKWGAALVVVEGGEAEKKTAAAIADLPLIAVQTVFVQAGEKKLTIYRGTSEHSTLDTPALLGSADGSKDGDAHWTKLSEWVKEERRPWFGQINEDNFELYMEHAKEGLFWICLDPSNIPASLLSYTDSLVSAAQKSKTKYPFVWLDVSEFEEHAKEELGCTEYPTLVLQKGDLLGERGDAKVDKYVRSFAKDPSELEKEETVLTFFKDVESGKLLAEPEPDELDELDGTDDEGEGENEEKGDL